jgi:hypothetical protein
VAKIYHDPVTGDVLTRSERVSWAVQGVIRRWLFLMVFTALTIAWWACPTLFGDPGRTWWNLVASYMAIFIESVVGIAMFSQTRRDALILREIRSLEQKQIALIEKQEALHAHVTGTAEEAK